MFRLLCNGKKFDLHQRESKQPDFIVSNLPRTNDFDASCTELQLPNLEIDERYTLKTTDSPLDEPEVIAVECDGGDLTVRQKMKKSEKQHITGSKVIIDDLMLRSTSIALLLLFQGCFLRVHFKYRTTLKLAKCDMLMKQFEFVEHDVLPQGNSTTSSKYDLINDWPLPETADSLHSFISLCNFYQKFLPLFETKVAPLRALYLKYLHKKIPINEWTDDLKFLFETLKADLTSQPVLACYDYDKPVILKNDWSALGLSFIPMQPCDDEESKQATKTLLQTGKCLFDMSVDGPRLQAIAS